MCSGVGVHTMKRILVIPATRSETPQVFADRAAIHGGVVATKHGAEANTASGGNDDGQTPRVSLSWRTNCT